MAHRKNTLDLNTMARRAAEFTNGWNCREEHTVFISGRHWNKRVGQVSRRFAHSMGAR